jgi:hypothetical protein
VGTKLDQRMKWSSLKELIDQATWSEASETNDLYRAFRIIEMLGLLDEAKVCIDSVEVEL